MQKVIALLAQSPVLSGFSKQAEFRRDIPFYTPDQILAEGIWHTDEQFVFDRRLIPAAIFFKDGAVLGYQNGHMFRIWFGEPVGQKDILQYPDCEHLLGRTLKKERIKQGTPYRFIGYCTWTQAQTLPEFLIIYAVCPEKKALLKNELWIHPEKDLSIYYAMDPLSRRIFDTVYESNDLREEFLFNKNKKNS